jgi:type VI secretion system secreted protein VgrG
MADIDLGAGTYETPIDIALEAEGLTPGVVVPYAFHVTERISDLFRVEVFCACGPGEVAPSDLVGGNALLSTTLPNQTERLFHGLVTEVQEWHEGTGRLAQRLRVVIRPRLWKLALARTSRIFQRLSVPEIVARVLQADGLDHELRLSETHAAREYCVQYMESNFAFVSRLLEEEGISYGFRHEREKHIMVMSDHNGAFDEIDGDSSVPFRESGGFTTGEDAVVELTNRGKMRAGLVSLNDFDPIRPALNLAVNASAPADTDMEIYDHHGRYVEPSDGKDLARIKLERQRWQTLVVQGVSHCGRFDAGRTFELNDHPDLALDKKYLLFAVSHHGRRHDLITPPEPGTEQPPEYTNEFEAIPAEVPHRPLRSAPWPMILGSQTAMVTGPAGEEIYTDQHGRVKVQFHWDRQGQHDEATTCWVRVNQGWAGPGWGAFFIPRIGHEVIVEFENGDPDRPLVTGRVYNGASPPPVDLPGSKTQSTVRSSSSPGGNGFNELRFEDRAGGEQIYLHAQKDMEIVVENDKDQLIKGNETLEVRKNRSREIQGNQILLVKGNDDSTIQLSESLTVNQNRSTTVGGNHTEAVAGNQAITIGAGHALTVAAASAENIGGARSVSVGAAMSVTVGGAMVETIGGAIDESVGGAKSESVGGNKTETVKGDHAVDVTGDWSEKIGKNRSVKVGGDALLGVNGNTSQTVKKTMKVDAKEIHFSAEDELQIKVGDASILMKKNGDVIIKGGKIEMTASGDMILKGSKIGEN